MMKFTGSLEDPRENDHYEVKINKNCIHATYCYRMMSQETGVLFPRSSVGLYELGRVRAHGAHMLESQVGDQFTKNRKF